MYAFFACLVFVVVTIVLKTIEYCIKSSRRENLYKKVGWIAEKEKRIYAYKDVDLRDEELIYYVMQQQMKMSIPKEFCIDFTNEDEKACIDKILNIHKDYVTEMYFSNFLSLSKNICKLTSEEYYMYSLYNFLYHNLDERDLKYLGYDIYKFKEQNKPYSTYTLTDEGRASYKIYLITLMFTETHERTRNLFEYINPETKKHIMDYLKTNEVEFVRFGAWI